MDINLELYKVFYYVATSLSFSEASRQLFISQSAVSQSIKTLEQETNRKIQALRDSLESRKDQELTALRQQTEQHLADLDVYYKENHRQLSEDLFQQLLKR